MNATQQNLFDMEPTAPPRSMPATVAKVETPRQRRRRLQQPTFDQFRPEAFKKSLKQKYREPRNDVRERIAALVMASAPRVVKAKFIGNPSDRDDVASEVAIAALPRAYRWKSGGKRTLAEYARGCCHFAFYDVMRKRNKDPREDALNHTETDSESALASIVDERDEPTFDGEEEE